MNKTNTAETTLNMIKSVYAERDRKESNRLRANRLEMDRREEAERERIQESNSILNSYIEKAQARENQHSQERNKSIQNLYDESVRRKSEEAHRSQEMADSIGSDYNNFRNNLSKSITDEELDDLIKTASTLEDHILINKILMDLIFPIDVITESMIPEKNNPVYI